MLRLLLILGSVLAAEAFVACLSSSGSPSRGLVCRFTLKPLLSNRPDSGEAVPDKYSYDVAVERRAAGLPVADHAQAWTGTQAALNDELHYRQLKQRFVESISSSDVMYSLMKGGLGLNFLDFCRGFGNQLKGIDAVPVDAEGTKLVGRTEVTVADLRRLYDDIDTHRTGSLTAQAILASDEKNTCEACSSN